MVVRSVATCIPAIPNTSKRIVILSAAVAGAAVSANIAARRQRRDRCGKRHRSGILDTSQPCRAGPARQPGRRLDRVRGALLNARAGYGTGRVAQRESTPFTRVGSQVQSLSRPPFIVNDLPELFALIQNSCPTVSPQRGCKRVPLVNKSGAEFVPFHQPSLRRPGWLRISHAYHQEGTLGPGPGSIE